MTLLPYTAGMSFARHLFSSGLLTEPELESTVVNTNPLAIHLPHTPCQEAPSPSPR